MFQNSHDFNIHRSQFISNQYDIHVPSLEHDLRFRLKPDLHPGHKQCLKGTRVEFLNNVILSMLSNSIVLIHGRAGTGKSSIAGSLAQILDKKQHPGLTDLEMAMSFYCIRESRDKDVSVLVPTLVYHLACAFPAFEEKLASDSKLNIGGDLSTQFNNLLLEPLQALKEEQKTSIAKKIAIIIDGLDEWGYEDDRKLFLTELQNLCREHEWMRFVITSRPNPEIAVEFLPEDTGLFRRMDLSQDNKTEDDIKTFIKDYWRKHSKLAKTLSEVQILTLLPYINSLFILADVVCKFLSQRPDRNFKILQNTETGFKSGKNSYDVLYSLYETVLTESIEDPTNQLSSYMNVISTICILQKPLSMDALKKFTNSDARDIVESLSAVLYTDLEDKVHYHLSFQEFILDREWPKRRLQKDLYQFNVNVEKQHEVIGSMCLKHMEQQLKFNICHLESSYISNEAVTNPDMKERVQKYISEELRYSCESWVHHACAAGENSQCWANIASFIQSTNIVYWMESLSCLNETSQIRTSMDYLAKTTKILDIKIGSKDISKFISAFFLPVSHSTPHLYVSALALAPKKTWLAGCMSKNLKDVLKVRHEGWDQFWSKEINQINVRASVGFVAYSPDGKEIVSGSSNETVRIWSAETGFPIGEPLRGHTASVWSVAYSPDGKLIVSGSHDKTVRIWSAETGFPIGEPLRGHTDSVLSMAYSPDGKQIVSGSSDETVRIWSAETGFPIGEPLRGHTDSVWSVAYSPDGKQIVSGSLDETVRIWSAETGFPIGEPLRGHTDSVSSVAYSPDG
ncbi:WD40 repeat-like protein, partial [Gymnopus androsaceus JB14]